MKDEKKHDKLYTQSITIDTQNFGSNN